MVDRDGTPQSVAPAVESARCRLGHVVCFSTCTQALLHEQRCRSLVTPQSSRRRVTVQPASTGTSPGLAGSSRSYAGSVFVWASALLGTTRPIRYCVCSTLLPRCSAISQCSLGRYPLLPSAHQWGLINEMPRDQCSVRAVPLVLQDWSCRLALT